MEAGLDRRCDGGEFLLHAKSAWGERLHRTDDLLVSEASPNLPVPRTGVLLEINGSGSF